MFTIIRRFGIQAIFIAMLCACGTSQNGGTGGKAEDDDVAAEVPEPNRKKFYVDYSIVIGLFMEAQREAKPGISDKDLVEHVREGHEKALKNIAAKYGITEDQARKILKEGERKRWVDAAIKEFAQKKEKKITDGKAAEEKRLAERTPEQKTKDEADRIAKDKEAARLAAIKAQAERIAKERADAEAAIAKKASDEVEAQRLYDKITARIHLLELIEKYPDTMAAKKARERLAKLDKK